MKIPLQFDFAWRYLFGSGPVRKNAFKRIRGGVIGIAISILPLVLVYEIASGMIEGISVRFLEISTSHVLVEDALGRPVEELSTAATNIEKAGLAANAAAEIQGAGLIKGARESTGVIIRAMDPGILTDDPGFARFMEMVSGDFSLQNSDDMVVGQAIAQKLQLQVGDKVRLLTYAGDDFAGLPRISHFTVKGIVTSGYQDLDKLWIFISLEKAGRILNIKSSRRMLKLKIPDPYQLPNTLIFRGPSISGAQGQNFANLQDYILRMKGLLGEEWLISTWYELQEGELNHYTATKNSLIVIMILMVVIAAVNVMSTMILFSVEKQFDIAILRSMGARPQDLGGIFLMMGTIVGSMGALLGIGGGLIAANFINEIIRGLEWLINLVSGMWHADPFNFLNPEFYLVHIPVHIHWLDMVGIFLIAMMLSLLASWLPARRVAKMKAMDIIRKV